MRVVDLIKNIDNTAFSFEVLPPIKGTGIEKLYDTVEKLLEFDPKYINITTHRSEYVYKELGNGLFERSRLRRRPGTVAVAAALHNKYHITTVPHILCSGFSREDIEYELLDLQFLNITDLLVLRGDKAKHESVFTPEPNGPSHAIELEEQINNFNKGVFVDGSPIKITNTPFSYGVACYPEKHDTVSASTDVEEFVVDGRECARLYVTYRLRQGTEYIYSNEVFIMRKDENGHWKILGWELLEEEEVESLQETMGTSEEE